MPSCGSWHFINCLNLSWLDPIKLLISYDIDCFFRFQPPNAFLTWTGLLLLKWRPPQYGELPVISSQDFNVIFCSFVWINQTLMEMRLWDDILELLWSQRYLFRFHKCLFVNLFRICCPILWVSIEIRLEWYSESGMETIAQNPQEVLENDKRDHSNRKIQIANSIYS